MRELLIAAATLIAALIFLLTGFGESEERVYNCDLAEFHPDYPAKVKEECRRLRSPPKYTT